MEKRQASSENKTRRVIISVFLLRSRITLGFCNVAAAYGENGTEVKDIAILFATAYYLGHSSGFGASCGRCIYRKIRLRRQWVLFAQTGMAVSLGGLLVIDATIGG